MAPGMPPNMGWGGGVGTAFPALMSISFTSYVAETSRKEKIGWYGYVAQYADSTG